jgi:hypothetical protein
VVVFLGCTISRWTRSNRWCCNFTSIFWNYWFSFHTFDGGRTATHEVGHYLNIYLGGDGRCKTIFVSDTPSSDGPNYDLSFLPWNCRSNFDMTMNYMDYTDDACMVCSLKGQKTRNTFYFAAGGPRAAMLN